MIRVLIFFVYFATLLLHNVRVYFSRILPWQNLCQIQVIHFFI